MSLEELLSQRKTSILKRWLDLIEGSHPAGAPPFTRERDEFTNPEGFITSHEIDTLYDELLQDKFNSERVCASLENIIRIRTVQDLSPAQAVAFVFLLKQAITEKLQSEIEKRQLLGQWFEFELKIDKLACRAFETYMQCREKINQLRVNEVKADKERAFRLIEVMDTVGRKHIEATE